MIRQSKFRHVFGKPLKKEQCYDNIRITKISGDSTFCAVNPKYLAIITEAAGGGSFLVHSLDKTGRVDRDSPRVVGHKASVLDIKWCPHDDDVIASCSEDCSVKVWRIPEEGLFRHLDEPVSDLLGHQRRVGFIEWHPSAQDVILSCSADQKVIVWNAGTCEMVVSIEFPEPPITASWNYNGSRFVVSCKDRIVRLIDARSGVVLKEKEMHQGCKATHAVILKDDRVFSTGFSKRSERQYGLWDKDLENLAMEDLDNSNGILLPFYDPDTSVVYLCGKGDAVIKYFEVNDEAPFVHFLNSYQSPEPQRGIGFMPKRGLDVCSNEIARFYKLYTKGLCEVIPMKVPRKSELFQEDLYPDTAGEQAALTAAQWIAGQDAGPVLISLKERSDLFKHPANKPARSNVLASRTVSNQLPTPLLHSSTNQVIKTPLQATQSLAPPPLHHTPAPPPAAAVVPAAAADNNDILRSKTTNHTSTTNHQTANHQATNHQATNNADRELVQSLSDDVRKLKIIAKGHERRIKELEEKLARCQVDEDEDDDDDVDCRERGNDNDAGGGDNDVESNGIDHGSEKRSTLI